MAVAATMVIMVLPAPAAAYTGFDTSTPLPKYAVMDSFETAFPYVDYPLMSASDPGVTDWSGVLQYCPSALTDIGFSFPFYGTEYTKAHISPKGFLTFEDPTPCTGTPSYYCYNDSPYYFYYGSDPTRCDSAREALYGPWDYSSSWRTYGTSTWGSEYGYESTSKSTYGTPPTTYEYKSCSGGYPPWSFPTASKPNKFFGVWFPGTGPSCFGVDLGGHIYSKTVGAAGTRQFIVQYQDIPSGYYYYNYGTPYSYVYPYKANMELVLYEEDGHMEIHIKSVQNPYWYPLIIGIEDASGAKGHRYTTRVPGYGGSILNRAIAYYPPPTATILTDPAKACINVPFTLIPQVKAARTLGGITKYDWTFADGTTSNEATPQKVYYTRGNYTIRLDLTFAIGIKFPTTTTLRVYNCIPPIAHFDVTADDQVGATPSDKSYDPDGYVVDWRWDWGDGTAQVRGVDPGTHYYEAAQTFDITLVVTDTEGFTDSFTQPVITHGVPIVLSPGLVSSAGPDQQAKPGQTVHLDGRGGDAWRATRFNWEQVLPKDKDATGQELGGQVVMLADEHSTQPSFVAPELLGDAPETFQFALEIGDGHHTSTIDTVNVTVVPPTGRPVADAGESRLVSAATEVALDGSLSADPDGSQLTYQWTQVSGEPVTLSDAKAVKPTFTAPTTDGPVKELVFALTVSDGGLNSRESKVTIEVMPVTETALTGFVVEKLTNVEPGRVVFRALAEGMPMRYVWDFGDGQKGEGPFAPHVYAKTGDYTVLLETFDMDGKLQKSHTQTVSVYSPEARSGGEVVPDDGAAQAAPMASGLAVLIVVAAAAMLARRRD